MHAKTQMIREYVELKKEASHKRPHSTLAIHMKSLKLGTRETGSRVVNCPETGDKMKIVGRGFFGR